MSCGQAPGYDDVCAGDRLGRLLNRARTGGGEEEGHTPSITPAHLHTADGQMQPTGADHGEGVQVCTDIRGDTNLSPSQEVRR